MAGLSVLIAPVTASPARSTATSSNASCCPSAVRFAEGFLTAMGRPAESVTLGSGDVRYERRQGSTREAVHSGLGTAARSAGDILLENAPKRARRCVFPATPS